MTQDPNNIRLSQRHLVILHFVACILVVSGGAAALHVLVASFGQDQTNANNDSLTPKE